MGGGKKKWEKKKDKNNETSVLEGKTEVNG